VPQAVPRGGSVRDHSLGVCAAGPSCGDSVRDFAEVGAGGIGDLVGAFGGGMLRGSSSIIWQLGLWAQPVICYFRRD